jgi:DNA-binding transcriptional regulator LsrR (DeoR family)
MNTVIALAWWLLLPLVVITAITLWATETQQQRIKRLHRSGHTQTAIAHRLGITRYQVRKTLA